VSSSGPGSVDSSRDDELVFNTRLTEPMLRYFSETFGEKALRELVARTDTSLEMLRDPEQWMSTSQLLALSRAMVEHSKDTRITYRAGLVLIDPKVLGPSYYVLRALGSPGMVYARMSEFTDLSRITRWKIVETGRKHVVMQFQVERGHRDDILFCLNRQGALAGVPQAFGLSIGTITHTQCLHEGGSCCEYRVEWLPPLLGQGLLPWLSLGSAAVTVALAAWMGTTSALPMAAALGTTALLGATVMLLQRQVAATARDQRDQLSAAKNLLDENVLRNRERLLLEAVDRATRQQTSAAGLVDTALNAICNTLGYDRAMFLRADHAKNRLVFSGGAGFDPEGLQLLSGLSLALRAERQDDLLFANLLNSSNGALVADVAEYKTHVNPDNQKLLDRFGSTAFIAVPVRGQDGPLGLLVVDQVYAERGLGPRDHHMLQQVGSLIGLGLASANLLDSLRREREVIEAALLLNQKISQYLPRTVVERIRLEPGEALKLGGERRRAAVLFSDIVGFTPWAERVEPELAVAFLNWYFTAMDAIIEEAHGILDKRIGDGMMVVFLEGPDIEPPARRALGCGLQMQRVIAALNEDPSRPITEPFGVRIGISYGEPVAGNLGSAQRMEYTVIGDTVNVASRIEGRCEPGRVLATAQAIEAAGPGVRAEPRGELTVKGRSQPVSAFEVQSVS
jgi:class 3 adenylate cyclase